MSIRKTKPMCGQILVQSESTGLKSDLIVIPDNAAQSPPNRGVIVSAGSDCNEVAVGDKVFFRAYAGIPHPDDDSLLFMDEEEVLAVETNGKAPPPQDVVEWVHDSVSLQ